MTFRGDENVSVNFLWGLKGGNFGFFDIKSYLVTYHWKGFLTIKIMTHRKGFYDIAGLNNLELF